MRVWFLTSTTYGTWLPGDERGFVSAVPQPFGPQLRNNRIGTEYDRNQPGLTKSARDLQKHNAVHLNRQHAIAIADQFEETASYRGWTLHACAIMSNHFHIVVEVTDDPAPSTLLQSFKSYASRRLNRVFGARPVWWTDGGSVRKKSDERAILEAIRYTRDQDNPLVMRLNEESRYVKRLQLFDDEFPKRGNKSKP